ncbi:MAG: ATP-binding protein, partial [Candidatus Magnetoovum sp. WYHC-5]|nr:ATP-binding protein [Candidatus Magnetoovum sp. WYHC-5]
RNRHNQLLYRFRIEKLVSIISKDFINIDVDKLDSAINDALQKVGDFAGVDRSYIFIFYDNAKKASNTHEWCAHGITPEIQNLQNIETTAIPWWMSKMHRLECIHIPRVCDLPKEASAEKTILQAQDIQSLLVVPMIYANALYGFVGFDTVRTEKTWTTEDIEMLNMLGDIFTNALRRKQMETQLRLSQERLIQAEKIASFGKLALRVAHEINNPLTSAYIKLQTLMANENSTWHSIENKLTGVIKSIDKVANITKELMNISRVGELECILMNISDAIYEAISVVEYRLTGIVVHKNLLSQIDIYADPIKLEQVFINLLSNSIDAINDTGDIYITTTDEDNSVIVEVIDTGCGISAENIKNVFDPFFTTKAIGKGTGLGLSICYGVISQHNGTIELSSIPNRGTTVRLKLPCNIGRL